MAPSDLATLAVLGNRIAANAILLEKSLESRGLRQPSFNQDVDEDELSTADEDSSASDARVALLEDTQMLHDLILSPAEVLRKICWSSVDVAIQRVIYRHKIHEAVPLGNEGITYAALTTKTGLSQRRLKSIIRQSALNRVFEETSGQGVRHTASSAVLLRSQAMLDWYGHSLEEMCPSAVALATALEQESGTDQKQEQQNSAFQLAFNTTDPLFRFYERHKDRQARFFGAMAGVGRDQGHSLDYIVRGYDWAKLGKAIVVDVGGSSGFVSAALATAYPNLTFIVQDYKHTVEQGRDQLPACLLDRISFQAHDIFDPQPATAADVYILRHICHNWSDPQASTILRNLVPAMKPTSRILLVETVVVPPRGIERSLSSSPSGAMSALQERYMRNVDITMLTMLNAQERSAEDWQAVVTRTDERLEIIDIQQPTGSWDSIIEIGFKGGVR